MEEILASIRRIIADDQALAEAPTAAAPEKPVAAPVETLVERVAAKVAPVSVVPPAPKPIAEPPPAAPAADANGVVFVPPPIAESITDMAPPAVAPIAKAPDPFLQSKAPADNWPLGPAETPGGPPPLRTARQPDWHRHVGPGMQAPAEIAKLPLEAGRDPAAAPQPRPVEPATQPVPPKEEPLVSPATDQAVSGAFHALVASRLVPTSDAMAEMVRDMVRPMLKTWLDDNLPIMVERLVRAEIERVARGGR